MVVLMYSFELLLYPGNNYTKENSCFSVIYPRNSDLVIKKNSLEGEGQAPCMFRQCQRSIVEVPKNSKEITLKPIKKISSMKQIYQGPEDAI